MTPERWQQIEDILDEVMPLATEERAARIGRLCHDDTALKSQVEEMMGYCDLVQAESFLEAPPHLAAQDLLMESILTEGQDEDLRAGTRVGPYTIIERVGRGGMGEVYLAERADPRMRVALKVVKRGMDTREILQRFRYEREILARLNHPHIAQLYGGDVTEDGRPYFAMEYVEGQTLEAYCDDRHLSIPARLALFKTVCEAVRYAHRNLVVHRDLKPGNILVSEGEAGQPLVKLLDFGIAKLLEEDASLHTMPMTQAGALRMTPGYAAPEQVRGQHTTPATDVYALGVILYGLLTGRRPYYFEDRSVTSIESVICLRMPERPSTVVVRPVRSSGDGVAETTLEELSQQRAASPPMLRRQLAGDLDAITMMALRKEPERRYPSAAEFLDDIERYLDSRPVAARHDTLAYRTAKFVRRHTAGVGIAAAMVLLITVLVTLFTIRLKNERDRVQLEATRANETLEVLVGMFDTVDPEEAQGRPIYPEDLIATGLRQVAFLGNQPLVQAKLMDVMGRVSYSVGQLDLADSLHQAALAIRRQKLGEDHADVAESMYLLATTLVYRQDYDEAVRLYRQALAIQRKAHGERSPRLVKYLYGLAFSLYTQGRQGNGQEAEALYRQALDIGRPTLGETHPDVVQVLEGLADLLAGTCGVDDEAEHLYRQVVTIRRQTLGETHPRLADSIYGLASCLRTKGDLPAAKDYLYQALEIYRKVYHGEQHYRIATVLYVLAMVHEGLAEYQQAEALYERAAAIYRDTRPAGDSWPALPLVRLGALLIQRLDDERADDILLQALAILVQNPDRNGDKILETKIWLGRCRTLQRRYQEAEDLLLESYQGLDQRPNQTHSERVLAFLIALYEQWPKPDQADVYRAALEQQAAQSQ